MDNELPTLNHLEMLLKLAETEFESIKYDERDVRKSFFALYLTWLRDFYNGKISFLISGMITKSDVKFREEPFLKYYNHIKKFIEIREIEIYSHSHLMLLNRNVLNNSWTIFELSITLLFDELVSYEEKRSILLDKNRRLNKMLAKVDSISAEDKDSIINLVISKDFIPLVRKFRKIVDSKKYGRNYNKDIEFLNFYTNLRNCLLHSNSVYTGSSFEYSFRGADFLFEKNKMYKIKNDYDLVYLDLAIELKLIFRNCIKSFSHEQIIFYPDDFVDRDAKEPS